MPVKAITWKTYNSFGESHPISTSRRVCYSKNVNELDLTTHFHNILVSSNWSISNICLEKSLISVDEFLITGSFFFVSFLLMKLFLEFVVVCIWKWQNDLTTNANLFSFNFLSVFAFMSRQHWKKGRGTNKETTILFVLFLLLLPKEWQSLMKK